MMVNGNLVETYESKPKSNNHKITRNDIAELIGNDVHSYSKAKELYTQHTSKPFSPITARNQRGKWEMINGELIKI